MKQGQVAVNLIKTLMGLWLFTSPSVSAEVENIPEIGAEQTVYLGDRMVRQRFGFYDYEYCSTLKQDLIFTYRENERECLKSTKLFQRSYNFGNDISQIEKGGVLCPTGLEARKGIPYEGMNFFGYQRKDGSDKRPARPWSLRETKTKKQWLTRGNGTKVVDLPKAEFDQVFIEHKIFDVHVVKIDAGERCGNEPDVKFEGVQTFASGVSETPETFEDKKTIYFKRGDRSSLRG